MCSANGCAGVDIFKCSRPRGHQFEWHAAPDDAPDRDLPIEGNDPGRQIKMILIEALEGFIRKIDMFHGDGTRCTGDCDWQNRSHTQLIYPEQAFHPLPRFFPSMFWGWGRRRS